ncbi:CKLF-like MARVEL transmembrane domain-containing protein 7 [Branchiostoma floridae x Branchiostoma japonicum]
MPILMWWFPAVVEERETSTTTTTFPDGSTQSTTQTVRSRVPLTVDKEFVKSVPGVLKIVQMFLCFLAFLLSKIGWCFMTCGAYNFFGFVTMTSLLYELWTFLWYLTHGYMMISRVCWEKVDFIGTCVVIGLNLLASIILAAQAYDGTGSAAAAFGFFATFSFIAGAYVTWKLWKEGQEKVRIAKLEAQAAAGSPDFEEGSPPPYDSAINPNAI